MRSGTHGLTLIELMIVVAVVAILAAVAYPSYTNHVRRSNRVAAQAVMMDAAAREQQRMLDVRSFIDDTTSGTLANTNLSVVVPTNVASSYTLTATVNAGPPSTFTIKAAPKGSQQQDPCGTLTLDSTGAKTASGTGTSCW